MTLPRVLILLTIAVAATSRHVQKRDWVPARDWVRCAELEQQALDNLTGMREIMRGDGLNRLVTNGTLNLDCSPATLERNRKLSDDAWAMCVSSTDTDIAVFTSAYSRICTNRDAFIQSEACLSSGAPVEARSNCHLDTTDYEARCREEPVCIENNLRLRSECSSQIASLLRGMAAIEFGPFMGDNCIRFVDNKDPNDFAICIRLKSHTIRFSCDSQVRIRREEETPMSVTVTEREKKKA